MDWISKWSSEAPAHPAVVEVARERVLSYQALDRGAQQGAEVLQSQFGVVPGDRVVAVMSDRCELLELCFACRRIGAIFVPVAGRLGERRVAALVRDCRPAVVVREGGDALVAQRGNDAVRDPGVDRKDVAMILYQSGPGRPGGVMLPWRQVEFNAEAAAERLALSFDDRGLTGVSLVDSFGLNGVAMPLLRCGGTVVLGGQLSAAQMVRVVEGFGVTTLMAWPVTYRQLLPHGQEAPLPERLRRRLLVAGTPCSAEMIAAYRQAGLGLRNGYGSAEVGPICFTFGVGDRPDCVGEPVPGSRARVVGEDGETVAAGRAGELWLKGPHVSGGYWGQPERTERRWRVDGWFCTGARAWQDEDGQYYVLGKQASTRARARGSGHGPGMRRTEAAAAARRKVK